MKVVCLGKYEAVENLKPEINQVYTVVSCGMLNYQVVYCLKEMPFSSTGIPVLWGAEGFVPLELYKTNELQKIIDEIL